MLESSQFRNAENFVYNSDDILYIGPWYNRTGCWNNGTTEYCVAGRLKNEEMEYGLGFPKIPLFPSFQFSISRI
jgi:hypothetical protein